MNAAAKRLPLNQTEQELQSISNAINRVQAVIEFHLDGTIAYANDNFLNVLGYTLDEIKSQHHRMFCEPEYASSIPYKLFWEKLNRGEFESGEFKRLGKNGREVWIQASYNPIFDEQGKVYKVVKFATDITAAKIKNAEVEGKLNAINRSQAVIEFYLDGTIITANQNFLNTVGYALDEVQNQHHRLFCHPDYSQTTAYQEFWNKLARGEFDRGRYKRLGKGNREVWIQASYNPIFDMNGKVYKVVKFATDITLQVSIETTVKKLAEDFMKASESIAERSKSVAQGAQSLGETTENMNSSVDELNQSIHFIAQNAKNTDQMAKATHGDAETGAKYIEKAIESMELISKSSEDIEEIVKVISEIASQTNLLAFNAAIEAARAGEHGLGFSVVADEVRKLAERSSQATKDISKLIRESVKRVTQGAEVSKQAGQAFDKIVSGVLKTTQSISEVSLSAEEQLVAAKSISHSVQNVMEEAEKSAKASDQIASATKALMEGSQELSKTIAQFETQ